MRKDLKLLIILFLLAISYAWLRYGVNDNWKAKLKKPIIINLDKDGSNYKRAHFLFEIDSLINIRDFKNATKRIDSALKENKSDYILLDSKGRLLLMEGNTRQSLPFFNAAIVIEGEVPRMLEHRSNAYQQLGLYDSSILDLKKGSFWRTDFYLGIAETYEKTKRIDSAIKYYSLYFDSNPDSVKILIKVKNLRQGG